MTNRIVLPTSDGNLIPYTMNQTNTFQATGEALTSRTAYAAPHVVCDPLVDVSPNGPPHIDWEATLAYRQYLWSLGLSVAEAMDTAQRGMGLNWEVSKELIRRSINEAKAMGGEIACGAGTDHLNLGINITLENVESAYLEQCEFVESHGGKIILMASRALAASAKGPEDYQQVYSNILSQVKSPVILHWLGDMFDPQLSGYWGHQDLHAAMDACLSIIEQHQGKVEGIKLSLLDEQMEIQMRRRLPDGVRMYTGDDFNYPQLILGDEQGFSHALLGIFDAIAPAASAAIQALDKGDAQQFKRILEPTVPLSRHIFKSPTYYYKAGIVFLAYLNGHQSHFRMVGGMESSRSIIHLAELFRLADQANILRFPDLAAHRMRSVMALAGIC